MRFIAGAIVVLSGCILWGAGACAVAWTYEAKGNLNSPNMANYGGMLVVAIGCLILFAEHFGRGPKD